MEMLRVVRTERLSDEYLIGRAQDKRCGEKMIELIWTFIEEYAGYIGKRMVSDELPGKRK